MAGAAPSRSRIQVRIADVWRARGGEPVSAGRADPSDAAGGGGSPLQGHEEVEERGGERHRASRTKPRSTPVGRREGWQPDPADGRAAASRARPRAPGRAETMGAGNRCRRQSGRPLRPRPRRPTRRPRRPTPEAGPGGRRIGGDALPARRDQDPAGMCRRPRQAPRLILLYRRRQGDAGRRRLAGFLQGENSGTKAGNHAAALDSPGRRGSLIRV